MNNIQPIQVSTSSTTVSEQKPTETVVTQQNISHQKYEDFKIVGSNDSRFYATRSLKVERISFKLG